MQANRGSCLHCARSRARAGFGFGFGPQLDCDCLLWRSVWNSRPLIEREMGARRVLAARPEVELDSRRIARVRGALNIATLIAPLSGLVSRLRDRAP